MAPRARRLSIVALAALAMTFAVATQGGAEGGSQGPAQEPRPAAHRTTGCVTPELCNLDRLIFIIQENRSFDHYFGTYENPNGATVAGIPRKPGGGFKPCIPHPVLGKCVRPFKMTNPVNYGGPHAHQHAHIDVANGKMNGFINAAYRTQQSGAYHCVADPFAPSCRDNNGPARQPDLMGTMQRGVIPNYWAYADEFYLQDHLFGATDSWSLPAHLYIFSAWSAECKAGPMSCKTNVETHSSGPYKWTDITYLLEEQGVTWKTYVGNGTDLSCGNWPCAPDNKKTATPWIWNPQPNFQTIKENGQVDQIVHVSEFFDDAQNGTLPEVVWLLPGESESEHPNHGSLKPGHAYVTKVVNAIGNNPAMWANSAIFLTWDDWGGFYDHMKPPKVDPWGYGLRVPGLMISPYAKTCGPGPDEGCVDHQTLSFDAYLKFIEDVFLGGQRLDPTNPNAMSRPDSRPNVRENQDKLGDLSSEFDFSQPPRLPPTG